MTLQTISALVAAALGSIIAVYAAVSPTSTVSEPTTVTDVTGMVVVVVARGNVVVVVPNVVVIVVTFAVVRVVKSSHPAIASVTNEITKKHKNLTNPFDTDTPSFM